MPDTGRTTAWRGSAPEAACGTGSYEWWPAEDRLIWSPELIRVYGLTQAPAAEDGFSQLVHPEDRVRVEAETSAHLGSDAESFSHSFRIVRPDGSVRFILHRGAIERDQKGVVRVIRGFNIDLTDEPYPDGRTMAGDRSGVQQVVDVAWIEEKLRESAATLLHAQRCADAGVWDIDLVNNRVTWSEPYYDLYGLPRTVQPSHESWIASIHADDRERVNNEFAQAVAGRAAQRIEFRILRDGQLRWLHSEGRVICDSANHPLRVTGITWDITARKLAEEALRESEERLRLAIDAGCMASWDWHIPTGAVQWNEEHYRMLGYKPGEVKPSYATWAIRVLPEDFPATEALLLRTMEHGGDYQAEFRVLSQNDQIRWLEARGRFERDGEGRSIRSYGVMMDITERKLAEEALRESEERLRAVLDGSPDPIFVKDLEGRQVMANPATYAAIGKPAEACLGKTDEQFLDDPADGRAIMATDRRIMASGQAETVEEKFAIPSGTRYFVSNKTPYRDPAGNVIGLIGTARDVTALKQAEEALRESEERERLKRQELEAILEAIPAAVFIAKDPACANMSVNRASEELLRLSANANASLSAPEGEAPQHLSVHAKGRALRPCELPVQRAAATKSTIKGAEFEVHFVDGDCKHFFGNAMPLLDDSGEVRGAVGAFIDITERKQAEKALRKSEERYRQLADAMPQLVWAANSDGAVDYYNARVVEYGITLSSPPISDDWALAIHPDDLASTLEAWREAAARGQTYQKEHRVLMADGGYRWHLSRGHPQHNEEGVIVKWFGTSTDIDDLKQAEARLAADFAALTRLHALSARTLQTEGLEPLLQEVVEAAVAIVKADHGTLRLLEGETLRIAAHHGHQPAFLESFADVANRASICATAVARRERIVVPDVETSDLLAGTPSLPVLRTAGVRAVQSTPLVSREGKLLGVLSTQWDKPYRPDEHDLWRIDLLSRQAADLIENIRAATALRESEGRERQRRQELETTLAVLPVGVFIAEDKACARITANPAGNALLRISEGRNASKSAPDDESPSFGTYSATGEVLAVDRLPMQRAAATGESIKSFEHELRFADGGHKHLLGNALPLFDAAGEVRGAVGAFLDITERRHQEERIKLLLREVNHRAKNMLAVVQSVARQTAAANPKDFLQRFSERVQALATSQDLLVKAEWRGVELGDLVRGQLAHFQDLIGSRIELKGPSLRVSVSAAQILGMAIHELSTNAGKYGALSVTEGRIAIGWGLERDGAGGDTFTMSWREHGGPPVSTPSRNGFGSAVIGAMTESSLDGKVDLDFLKTGLSWRLHCPAAGVSEGARSAPGAKARPELGAPRSSRPKVLVVEDEALVAMEIAQVLRDADFEVLGPARSVAAALSLIEESGCDTAVLDINLSGETSERVARKLLANGTRFVTLSGYSRAQHLPIFDGVPALAKPLRSAELIAEIKRCLASKENREGKVAH